MDDLGEFKELIDYLNPRTKGEICIVMLWFKPIWNSVSVPGYQEPAEFCKN